MDGILIVNKQAGLTSHDCLKKLGCIFKNEKMGHTGTLDPAATGVLVVCIGKARKLMQFMVHHSKEYTGDIVLGIKTESGDSMGNIVTAKKDFSIYWEELSEAIKSLTGEIDQTPPMVSAVKHKGTPLHVLARKGISVKVPSRKVTIHKFLVDYSNLSYPLKFQSAIPFVIECSKGTYIRKIAMDLGDMLGCGAHLASLDRTRAGPFNKKNSHTISKIIQLYEQGELSSVLLPMDSGIQNIPAVYIDESACPSVCSGSILYPQGILDKSGHINAGEIVRVYSNQSQLLSMAKSVQEGDRLIYKPLKVLRGR